MLEAAAEQDPLAERGGGPPVALGGRARRGRPGTPAGSRAAASGPGAALQRAPGEGELPRRSRSPSCRARRAASRPSRKAPKPTTSRRASGTRSSTSGQAASSRSGPLLTISLPTKTTSGSPPVSTAQRRARPPRVAREGALRGAPGSRSAATLQLARPGRPRRPSPVVLAGARSGTRPRREGRAACARGSSGSAIVSPQALGRVAGAHEHGPRRRQALAGEAQEALRFGLDGVLERAAVDLDRVGDLAVQRPGEDHGPHHEVVGERQLGADERGHLGHGGDVRLQVARSCSSLSSAKVRASTPS